MYHVQENAARSYQVEFPIDQVDEGSQSARAVCDQASQRLDAAAQVLHNHGKPMTCKAIVEIMLAKGMWKTGGKTPAATIYSAMLREIDNQPGESRFAKIGRGLFAPAKSEA